MIKSEPPADPILSSNNPSEAEEVDDDTESDSSLKGPYTIRSYGVDYTVDSLVKRMDTNAFIVPEFQRKFLWSKTHASRFIESLLMGLPVPGAACKILIDSERRKNTRASNDVRARQLVRF